MSGFWCQKKHFTHELAIFWSAEKWCRHFFPHPPSPFPCNCFANATVVAFVLLHNSRFNFHCYTQQEPALSQKSAQKWQLQPFCKSCMKDYKGDTVVQRGYTCVFLSSAWRNVGLTMTYNRYDVMLSCDVEFYIIEYSLHHTCYMSLSCQHSSKQWTGKQCSSTKNR